MSSAARNCPHCGWHKSQAGTVAPWIIALVAAWIIALVILALLPDQRIEQG
jgi:hypothetical protein